MKIEKIINNNIVSALDNDGKEIVVMGRGLGFQKKAGQLLDEKNIEKVFRLESDDIRERFKDLLANMPLSHIQVSDEIISYARTVLKMELSQNVYLTLMDHINFALDRFSQGMLFENALYDEIRRFYPEEFQVGQYSLQLIKERTGVMLPEDEAASIAIHLVNAEYNMKMHDSAKMIGMLRDLMKLTEKEICFRKEGDFYRDLFSSNLKLIIHRMLFLEPESKKPDKDLKAFAMRALKKEYELTEKMNNYLQKAYGCQMTEEEQIYLTLQLKFVDNV